MTVIKYNADTGRVVLSSQLGAIQPPSSRHNACLTALNELQSVNLNRDLHNAVTTSSTKTWLQRHLGLDCKNNLRILKPQATTALTRSLDNTPCSCQMQVIQTGRSETESLIVNTESYYSGTIVSTNPCPFFTHVSLEQQANRPGRLGSLPRAQRSASKVSFRAHLGRGS